MVNLHRNNEKTETSEDAYPGHQGKGTWDEEELDIPPLEERGPDNDAPAASGEAKDNCPPWPDNVQ